MKGIMKKIKKFITKERIKKLLMFLGCIILFILVCYGYIFLKKTIRKRNLSNYDYLEKHISLSYNQSIGAMIVSKPDDVNIFTTNYQNIVDNLIEKELESGNYSFESPLMIYNPYGTNKNAINVYTNEDIDVTYNISVDGYNDFERTPLNGKEFQVIGLITGENNTLTLKTNDDEMTYTIDLSNIKGTTQKKLDTKDGDSDEKLENGLYTVLGLDKNYNSNIYLFDNDGVLRSELVLKSYRTDRIIFLDDSMIYSYSSNGFVKVNSLGKIEKFYKIEGYKLHHDVVYDEDNDKLVILVNELDTSTIEDVVITLDLNTSKVSKLLDMKDYLTDMYYSAESPEGGNTYGGDELDWVHLNSLQVVDGDIYLSSRELSTLIKISDIYNKKNLEYLISDQSMYTDTKYKDKLLTKLGDFTSNAGQHTITYVADDSLDDGQYYLDMYDNNFGNSRTRPNFDWDNYDGVGTYTKGEASYYYRYLVDENERTYKLIKKVKLPYSSIVSSIQNLDNNLMTSSGMSHCFNEYDEDGNMIKQYNYKANKYAYRVFKYTYKNIWFK